MASLTPGTKDKSWYANSRCLEHITKSKEVFNTYCDNPFQKKPVEIIGGQIVYVKDIKDIFIKTFVNNSEEIFVL
jgi:hypothetical protein